MNITVFTPTYNRAYIIGNLYSSLKRQTYHDFEWLIVDDGSTDDTEELVEKWMKEDIKRGDCLLASEGATLGENLYWNIQISNLMKYLL